MNRPNFEADAEAHARKWSGTTGADNSINVERAKLLYAGFLAGTARAEEVYEPMLKIAEDALGSIAKLVHFFPPTHIFQLGSDAQGLQDRAMKVYEECHRAYAKIREMKEAGK